MRGLGEESGDRYSETGNRTQELTLISVTLNVRTDFCVLTDGGGRGLRVRSQLKNRTSSPPPYLSHLYIILVLLLSLFC